MDAKPRSLKDIFDTQCRYMVPLYQRPYVWKQSEQWEPLWEDIAALAERYMRNDSQHPHFMGAVVLEQLNTATGTISIRQIIDGQQRLTTLQIVIEAACDVCETLGEDASEFAYNLRRLTRNNHRGKDLDEVYKVWPTNVDREHLRRVFKAKTPEELRQHYDGKAEEDVGAPIASGYVFFYQKIAEWLTTESDDLRIRKLIALENALYNGIQVVIIDLDEKDDAQMIFETLNARGTPLLASDLVKNYLLHAAEDCGQDMDSLYGRHWQPFDAAPFWREMVRAGRIRRPHIELFLQHYVTLLTRDDVLVTTLFNTFRQHFKSGSNPDPAVYLAELARYGKLYHRFYTAAADQREGRFFQRIQALDTTTVFPLLLLIFDRLAGQPEHAKKLAAILADLESYLVRRMVCELSTKSYNRLFIDALKDLWDADDGQLGARLRTYLLAQTSDIGRWPDDDEFARAWLTVEAYKRFKPQVRLRMILESLELQRRADPKTEEISLPKKALSIEHILPRGWAPENWPLPEDTLEAKQAREALIHTFGNLTLVTGYLNPTLSNRAWEQKKETMKDYTVLLLNGDLLKQGVWNETTIQERGKELFKLATQVWPYPVR